MTRFIRDFRIIPIVLVASVGLLALKVLGITTEGGYTLGAGHMAKSDKSAREAQRVASAQALRDSNIESIPVIAPPKLSWAQEMFNYPDITGSVGGAKPAADNAAEKPADKPGEKQAAKPVDPKPDPGGRVVPMETRPLSAAERAILERLQDRRHELDQRAKELDMRETLLQASEKRLEARMNELKEIESRINGAVSKKEESEAARFKSLVTMYESMKAKDAAKIFDRLDIKVLTEVVGQINPRRMSDILGQMSPEAAERLTLELAQRAKAADKTASPAELPKIEGRPAGG